MELCRRRLLWCGDVGELHGGGVALVRVCPCFDRVCHCDFDLRLELRLCKVGIDRNVCEEDQTGIDQFQNVLKLEIRCLVWRSTLDVNAGGVYGLLGKSSSCSLKLPLFRIGQRILHLILVAQIECSEAKSIVRRWYDKGRKLIQENEGRIKPLVCNITESYPDLLIQLPLV